MFVPPNPVSKDNDRCNITQSQLRCPIIIIAFEGLVCVTALVGSTHFPSLINQRLSNGLIVYMNFCIAIQHRISSNETISKQSYQKTRIVLETLR